jgi:hypothetical protein
MTSPLSQLIIASCIIVSWPSCDLTYCATYSYVGDAKSNFFVAQAENFTLRIRHAVRGSTVKRYLFDCLCAFATVKRCGHLTSLEHVFHTRQHLLLTCIPHIPTSVANREGANSGTKPMSGKLEFVDGTNRVWPDDQLWYGQPQDESRSGDIVSVGELLEASGLGSGDDGADGATIR